MDSDIFGIVPENTSSYAIRPAQVTERADSRPFRAGSIAASTRHTPYNRGWHDKAQIS